MEINPLLLTDYYKECHVDQYDPRIRAIVSYFTPRATRSNEDFLIMFGLQYYMKEYLIGGLIEKFLSLPKEEAEIKIKTYERVISHTLTPHHSDGNRWRELYKLGYLPLRINAVPEGTKVPIGCPMLEITNTDPKFAWLVNYLESAMSAILWHMMSSANVGYEYMKVVKEAFEGRVEVGPFAAIGDYSFRGQQGIEGAVTSGAAFLLSFVKTATIPSVMFLDKYYNNIGIDNLPIKVVGSGAIGTEHSVMCSSFALDGNERDLPIRLVSQVYPHDSFTLVGDSYDIFKFSKQLTENEVIDYFREKRVKEGLFIGVRPDSGDPVKIIFGDPDSGDEEFRKGIWGYFYNDSNPRNKYGFKRIKPGFKLLFADGVTPQKAKQIYDEYIKRGLDPSDVILGCGSYSMQSNYNPKTGIREPMTRDTYGIAIKSTFAVLTADNQPIANGIPLKRLSTNDQIFYSNYGGDNLVGVDIFKDPITGKGKKSHKGRILVYYETEEDKRKNNPAGLKWVDEIDLPEKSALIDSLAQKSAMQTVFLNGKLTNECSLREIRERLWGKK